MVEAIIIFLSKFEAKIFLKYELLEFYPSLTSETQFLWKYSYLVGLIKDDQTICRVSLRPHIVQSDSSTTP